jgi:hypothetical protein
MDSRNAKSKVHGIHIAFICLSHFVYFVCFCRSSYMYYPKKKEVVFWVYSLVDVYCVSEDPATCFHYFWLSIAFLPLLRREFRNR